MLGVERLRTSMLLRHSKTSHKGSSLLVPSTWPSRSSALSSMVRLGELASVGQLLSGTKAVWQALILTRCVADFNSDQLEDLLKLGNNTHSMSMGDSTPIGKSTAFVYSLQQSCPFPV